MLGTHRTYQSQTAGILLVVLCAGGGLYSRGWTGAKKGRSLLIAGGGDLVRDTASLQLCLRYGAPATKLAHDIVFELPVLAGVQPGGQGRIALVCLRDDSNVYGRFTLNDRRIATLASTLDHLIDGYSLP